MAPSAWTQPTNALPLPAIATAGSRSPLSSAGRMTVGADQGPVVVARTEAAAWRSPPVTCSSQATIAAPFAFIASTGAYALVIVIDVGVDHWVPLLDVLCQIPWREPEPMPQTAR